MNNLNDTINYLKNYDKKELKIMEVCGTHTSSIFKHGIKSLISKKIKLISGPGCPVCVTSVYYIDKLIEYSFKKNTCVLTFGDMMKVKGSKYSLTEAKAQGGNVEIFYSPLSAVKKAIKNKNTKYIIAAVGFETTAPIYCVLLEEIIKNNIQNIKLLTSIKTIIPAIEYICENEKGIDAFICPGNVSIIIGKNAYKNLALKYSKPFVISGFEAEHILSSIEKIISQINKNNISVENNYKNAVSDCGNLKAQQLMSKYFKAQNDYWRSIGVINNSGLYLKDEYKKYDAGSENNHNYSEKQSACKCTDVILGRISPLECKLFKSVCTPLNAYGPCMVSDEGACGIYYKNAERG